ncbi:phage tail assembly protein [Chelatococcus asaccharovorans]|uniref:Tail assembly chaperone E/41/14-like protein n=1 Tax=Chelatococcus asaccharovorans TaxID=28210 RepID=A0A2V3UB04_9HYPH|nr:phage tail assembly protein [Chelatococcus asaccharovorans]MBS7703331.1 phage tail assembly protein [Chelatococcus asaccharovorans]PXW61665.1 tail assembly chaperone E/41/14-like protein [Chelatococcus asaccharovorans]
METYTLLEPITFNGENITVLTYRRPKGRDLIKMDRPGVTESQKVLNLLVDLTERPKDLLLELDGRDFLQLSQSILPLLQLPQETSTT